MGAVPIRHASPAVENDVLMGQTLMGCGFFFLFFFSLFLNESTLAEMLWWVHTKELGILQHGSMCCVCVV